MQYKIRDLTKAKGMILDQTTVIEMELNGVQDFAEMSDRSGILRIQEIFDKIKDRMVKRMKDSEKFKWRNLRLTNKESHTRKNGEKTLN